MTAATRTATSRIASPIGLSLILPMLFILFLLVPAYSDASAVDQAPGAGRSQEMSLDEDEDADVFYDAIDRELDYDDGDGEAVCMGASWHDCDTCCLKLEFNRPFWDRRVSVSRPPGRTVRLSGGKLDSDLPELLLPLRLPGVRILRRRPGRRP